MTKEEIRKKIYGFLKYEENQNHALKITWPEGMMWIVKGLWPGYIEEVIWEHDSKAWKILERQCIFRLDEMREVIKHPEGSCGCIFIFSQPWNIEVHELTSDPGSYKEVGNLDCLPPEVDLLRAPRYDFLQIVKTKKWT